MSHPPQISQAVAENCDLLVAHVAGYGSCLVALSGGVDSAVVAKAAQLALGPAALAVTGTSSSLASGELDEAARVAEEIGIRHLPLATSEFDNPSYVRNAPDRCYFCKTELYEQLERLAAREGIAVIANGANLDDQGDHRPGMIAAGEHQVRSPLLECGFTKQDVRSAAAHWGLSVRDKPAMPCLSSRIAYGEEVTPERVAMVDAAEQFLRERGFRQLRVRYHKGDLARLEVSPDEVAALCQPELREPLVARLRGLGFKFVTLDLEGFRSGSLNTLVELQPAKNSRGHG